MVDVEQRRANRLPKNYFVQFKKFKFPMTSQPYHDAKISDISPGGICVESNQSFKEGEQLQVKLHVPRLNKFMPGFFKFYENDEEQYIEAIVEVAWIDGQHMGLRFVDLDKDVVRGITGLISDAVREAKRKSELEEADRLAK